MSRHTDDTVTGGVPEMPMMPQGRWRVEAYQRLERVACYCSILVQVRVKAEASLLAVVECV